MTFLKMFGSMANVVIKIILVLIVGFALYYGMTKFVIPGLENYLNTAIKAMMNNMMP